MKGRTSSTLSCTKYVKCFSVETRCYRLVLRLNFMGLWNYCTIKWKVILSNVKQKCGCLSPGSAVNLNKLNLIKTELFIKYFTETGPLYNPTMQQTNLRAGCKSTLQPGTMTDRLSQTFEDLVYLFSSEDKYKGISLDLRRRLPDR